MVGMSVCLSVKSNLTSGTSVHTVMYSAGNGNKIFVGFSLNRSIAEIQRCSVESHTYRKFRESCSRQNSKSCACTHPKCRGPSIEDCMVERGVGIKCPGCR